MPNDRTIESFLILCETLNYGEAARRLFLSHQALSRQIVKLEGELGHTLFARSTRSVCLTAVGELFRDYFTGERERYGQVCAEAERLEYVGSNDLRIGCPLGLRAPDRVKDAVERFRSACPDAGIHMEWYDVDVLPQKFEGDALDLVVSLDDSGLQEYEGFRRLPLMETRRVLAVSANHPCYGARSLAEFSGQLFCYEAATREADRFLRENIAQVLERAGVMEARIERAPNLESRQNAVELGLGCCLSMDLDTLCAKPQIRTFPLDTPATGISCYWKPENPKQAVRVFVELLEEEERGALE